MFVFLFLSTGAENLVALVTVAKRQPSFAIIGYASRCKLILILTFQQHSVCVWEDNLCVHDLFSVLSLFEVFLIYNFKEIVHPKRSFFGVKYFNMFFILFKMSLSVSYLCSESFFSCVRFSLHSLCVCERVTASRSSFYKCISTNGTWMFLYFCLFESSFI